MATRHAFLKTLLAAVAAAALAGGALAQGVTATEVKIGNIMPYSGPASAYGTIGKVIGAYFRMLNDEGGVHGRKLVLLSYDDGYSPPRTVEMARRLVEQDEVVAIFNPLGTPSNSAIMKYMNSRKVPHLFVATGASKWNDPRNFPWTMGWQPSYQTEGRIYAEYALKHVKDAKIAVLYQNDDYGKDYLKGFEDGLGKANQSRIVLKQSYEVTDPTVDSQIVNLKNSGANVFFNITTPKFAVQAIRKAHEIGWKPLHFVNNISASVGVVMLPAGAEASKGAISVQYFKDPTDPEWDDDPAMKRWRAFMKKYYPEGNVKDGFNVYGVLVAQTMEQVLRQAGRDLTRASLMRQAQSLRNVDLPLLLPGVVLNTSPTDHAPIEQEQLVRFDGARWVRFGEVLGRRD